MRQAESSTSAQPGRWAADGSGPGRGRLAVEPPPEPVARCSPGPAGDLSLLLRLAAGHLEDLRSSGLIDEMILAAGIFPAPERQVPAFPGYGGRPRHGDPVGLTERARALVEHTATLNPMEPKDGALRLGGSSALFAAVGGAA
jgi:hypothetical protein